MVICTLTILISVLQVYSRYPSLYLPPFTDKQEESLGKTDTRMMLHFYFWDTSLLGQEIQMAQAKECLSLTEMSENQANTFLLNKAVNNIIKLNSFQHFTLISLVSIILSLDQRKGDCNFVQYPRPRLSLKLCPALANMRTYLFLSFIINIHFYRSYRSYY